MAEPHVWFQSLDVTPVQPRCAGCTLAVVTPAEGVIVAGSIFVADALKPGGLIGTAMAPDRTPPVQAYHWRCFLKALGWGTTAVRDRGDALGIIDWIYPKPR